jgi:hypothetical protein
MEGARSGAFENYRRFGLKPAVVGLSDETQNNRALPVRSSFLTRCCDNCSPLEASVEVIKTFFGLCHKVRFEHFKKLSVKDPSNAG